jgi:hypothetical protein
VRGLRGLVLIGFTFCLGIAAGVIVDRWYTGTLVRSDTVCAAAQQELRTIEDRGSRQPSIVADQTSNAIIERVQSTIARNCGWLPSTVTLPVPKPTDAPKPTTVPKPSG